MLQLQTFDTMMRCKGVLAGSLRLLLVVGAVVVLPSFWKADKTAFQRDLVERPSLRRRGLQDAAVPYRVQLFLALFYLNNDVAAEFESSSPSWSEALSHFCKTVNTQVSLTCYSE